MREIAQDGRKAVPAGRPMACAGYAFVADAGSTMLVIESLDPCTGRRFEIGVDQCIQF